MLGKKALTKTRHACERRLERADLLGCRLVFKDEIQEGVVWDQIEMCGHGSGKMIWTEVKPDRFIEYPNTAKLGIASNQLPHFTNPHAGKLVGRMHLFRAEGEVYANDTVKDFERLVDIIVEEEGPAILMWAIDEFYNLMNDPDRWARVTKVWRDATDEYARKGSPLRQWLSYEPNLVVDRRASMWRLDAYERYKKFAKNNGIAYESREGFKAALNALLPGKLAFTWWREDDCDKGAAMIRGLGPAQLVDGQGNIHEWPIPTLQPAVEGLSSSQGEKCTHTQGAEDIRSVS
jgi:phage/plasmid-associated DNA primase